MSSPGGTSDVAERIERVLREAFRPLHLRLRDDSARHAGHAGASSAGGHFKLWLVSTEFEGLSRLEQHRRVYEALGSMMGREIHALALSTCAPDEWRPEDGESGLNRSSGDLRRPERG